MGLARAEQCGVCNQELVSIVMAVDGQDLVMVSCQKCDTRAWTLDGEPVDLQHALAEVGEHSGRRRAVVSTTAVPATAGPQ